MKNAELKEAVAKYIESKELVLMGYSPEYIDDVKKDMEVAFRAGAKWMAGQGVKATASVGYYNQRGLSILTEPSIKKLGFEEGDELELTLRNKQ